ncbi:hypothetical protein PBY51_016658 [Eleginops maclovinus]|uniref:Uncharacterized protein n=1 Tax=Eleginops maclovinus TaxID=56733 RepID=A0AAN8A9Z6_ELEMC|nr:hypothetical protein PBY51_016658 [Eleginops maclovinus]
MLLCSQDGGEEVEEKEGCVDWENERGGGQDSDIHALRRGDTDTVSSPPLGQAVITVGRRFQVATLSGTGIIGSRLGATTRPRCGPIVRR